MFNPLYVQLMFFYSQFCMPDEARDGRNVALIDKCFMVCSIVQRRIKLLDIKECGIIITFAL